MPWYGSSNSGSGGGNGGTGGGKQAFTYTQTTAAETWTFIHDLTFEPGGMRITDFDAPTASWVVPVTYDENTKQFTLTFPIAVRGEVTVS